MTYRMQEKSSINKKKQDSYSKNFSACAELKDLSNLIMMSVYYMPFRGISRVTGGVINMPMLDGVLLMANGHFFRGLGKLIKEHRINKRGNK